MSDLFAGFVSGDEGHDGRRHFGGLAMRVNLDMRSSDLGELADLDMLAEERGGLFDVQLDIAVSGLGCKHVVHVVRVGGDGCVQHGLGELDELRGLCHEIGLGIDLNSVADLAVLGLDDLRRDGAFLGLAAFALTRCRDALCADDFLGAGDIAFGFGKSLLHIHHAGAGFFTHLLDQSCSDSCHVLSPLDFEVIPSGGRWLVSRRLG